MNSSKMKVNYYFLASSLPELQLGYPPDITFHAFKYMLQNNLVREDFEKTKVLRRYYDIQNIRAFWLEEEFDPRGYYNENELEEAIVTRQGFPEYVYNFLDKYDQEENRIKYFPALIAGYFRNEIEQAEDFLKEYLIFEREWRLVFTGFRAKQLGRDIAQELQFEDVHDEVVQQMMAQKDAKSYEPPSRYADLKALFEEHREAPLELHQALTEYRFHKINQMTGIDLFSINRILAYLAQLIIVEKWLELDKKKGLQIVEVIVKEAT